MLALHCFCHTCITWGFINQITKSKPLNVDAGCPLRLSSWNYALIYNQIPIHFRTKYKPLNIDAGSKLLLPSLYYVGIYKPDTYLF